MDFVNLQSEDDSVAAWRLRLFINAASDGEFELFLKSPPADALWQIAAYLSLEFAFHRRELRELELTGRVFAMLSAPVGMEALRRVRGPDRRVNIAWSEALEWAVEQSGGPAAAEASAFLAACVAPSEGESPGLLAEACGAILDARLMAGESGKQALAQGLRRLEAFESKEGQTAFWRFGIACSRAPGFMKEMRARGAPMPPTAALSGLISLARPVIQGAGPMGERARAQGMERYLKDLIEIGALSDETVERGMALTDKNLPLDARALLEAMWIKEATARADKSARGPKAPPPRL